MLEEMKQAALIDNRLVTETDVIKKAEMILKRDKLIEGLGDFISVKPCYEQIVELWEGFELMTFNMARASEEGMKVMDFEGMSAYGYLKYKKMLINSVKKVEHAE